MFSVFGSTIDVPLNLILVKFISINSHSHKNVKLKLTLENWEFINKVRKKFGFGINWDSINWQFLNTQSVNSDFRIIVLLKVQPSNKQELKLTPSSSHPSKEQLMKFT